MKKICYIITRSDWGGAQVHINSLINEFKNNNEIILIVGEKGILTEKLSGLNIKIYHVTELKRNIGLGDLIAVKKIKKIIDLETPDLVHLHSSKAGLIGRISTKLSNKKIPVIFTVHGWAFTPGAKKINRLIGYITEMILGKYVDKYICVSKYDEEIALKAGINSKKLVTVYNGVKKRGNIKKVNKNESIINLTMIARFNEQKNQKMLIDAVSHLDDDRIHLSFIGDGPNLIECINYTKSKKMEKKVDFLGFKIDAVNELQESDVFVLTSFYEGLPISIIEAMSLGLPIIASNVGGNKELVTEGQNGYLVNNISDLVKSLKLVSNNVTREAMGVKSKLLYEEKFTEEKCIKATNKIYKAFI